MAVAIDRFIEKYSAAILEGHAALFAGAGLSIPSGFVNWKELMRPFAAEINLSIDREHDYLAVAQYYCNEKGGNRSSISNEILKCFSEGRSTNETVDVVARLPIRTYWTTNYDSLIEDALKKHNRRPDVKRRVEDLALNQYDSDAVVYKMHGDITDPANVVLLKDDYETYEKKRGLFATALSGDLVSKTFLFVGFSFEDPNLGAIMGRIKSILGENVREHYCFFQRVQKQENEQEDDYKYREQKQLLTIHDLQRYGISTVLLDSYAEIPAILKSVEERVYKKNVFISGSTAVGDSSWSMTDAEKLSSDIALGLTSLDYQITSGYGLGIGSAVITGVLNGMKAKRFAHLDEHLRLFPFPQPSTGADFKEVWTAYREQMLHNCGIAVFVFGNKRDGASGKIVNANGMIQEYEIAKKNGARLIPIASTGFAAKAIFDMMEAEKATYPYLNKYWDVLRSEKQATKLVEVIHAIAKEE